MTTGEKLARLRKENNYTQEQLAELLGVSRQSISKYESGLVYPETEKLIRLSNLFNCTLDYLLKDDVETDGNAFAAAAGPEKSKEDKWGSFVSHFEKKSDRMVFGMPLWHIGKNAKGIIAIGIKAKGIISIGLISAGLISFGVVSFGLLALGVLVAGGAAVGCFALGGIACGAISAGIVALGAIAIGQFSIGALAIGHYFAYGEWASAMFAFGETKASGTVFECLRDLSSDEKQAVLGEMYQKIPAVYHWIINLVKGLL